MVVRRITRRTDKRRKKRINRVGTIQELFKVQRALWFRMSMQDSLFFPTFLLAIYPLLLRYCGSVSSHAPVLDRESARW